MGKPKPKETPQQRRDREERERQWFDEMSRDPRRDFSPGGGCRIKPLIEDDT